MSAQKSRSHVRPNVTCVVMKHGPQKQLRLVWRNGVEMGGGEKSGVCGALLEGENGECGAAARGRERGKLA